MYCGKCGSENVESALFCEKCGDKFLNEDTGIEEKKMTVEAGFLSRIFSLKTVVIAVVLLMAVVAGMFVFDFMQAPEKLKRNVKFDISKFGVIHNGNLLEKAEDSRNFDYKDDFFVFYNNTGLCIQTGPDESDFEEIEGVVHYTMAKFNDKPEKIVYLDKDHDLYLYDIKSKSSEQIDSEISLGRGFPFLISENSKYVAYLHGEGGSDIAVYLFDGNSSTEIASKIDNPSILGVGNNGNVILTDWKQVYIANEKEIKRISKYDNFTLNYISGSDEVLFSTTSVKSGFFLADRMNKAENLKFSMLPLGFYSRLNYYPQLNQLKKYWAFENDVLYYVNSKDNIKKIASTKGFWFSEDAKTVIFKTENALYRSDYKGLKPKRIYSGKITKFVISRSANEVYLINNNGELIYIKNEDKPVELLFEIKDLAINEDDIVFCLDDSGELYYAKNGKPGEDSLEYDVKDLDQSAYNNYVLYMQGDDVFVNRKGIEFK